MIRISNINVPINFDIKMLREKAAKILKTHDIDKVEIAKRSLDSRKKKEIHYVISLNVSLKKGVSEEKIISLSKDKRVSVINEIRYVFPYSVKGNELKYRPVIVGAGPAGYFAALKLSLAGARPIVIERGMDVETRKKDVEAFWDGGKLSPDSNVSFGEGGAGTFSDGKLSTGNKDKDGMIKDVLHTFYEMGADVSVTYDSKPHIGTDRLMTVMKNMRKAVKDNGGDIFFGCTLEKILLPESENDASGENRKKYSLIINAGLKRIKDGEKNIDTPLPENLFRRLDEERYELITDSLILAIGHSARDTFYMLHDIGTSMERKPFAMGLRIEHKAIDINRAQYGDDYDNKLPSADYKLTYHATNGRNVFSFCMCPGGYVVNSSTEEGGMVVNGMSYSGRNAENSNSAIVVSVMPEDFDDYDEKSEDGLKKVPYELAGIEFQRTLERRFFTAGQGNIPVQRYGDFKLGVKTEKLGRIKPLTKGRYTLSELKNCLPPYIGNAIIEGVDFFAERLRSFNDDDAVLSGIESRTSSPVRIVRDERFMSSLEGVFPCGEGAGYAGGITSASVDGIRCAEALMRYLSGNKEL